MNLGPRYLLLVGCLATPALAIDVQYLVAVRSDVRTRTALPGDLGAGVTGDLEWVPRAEVTLGGENSTFFAQYSPTLIWREPQMGGRFIPLHRARLALGHRWQRATLLLSQDGAYGVADVGSLRDPDVPTSVAEVQTVGTVPYVRSATLFALDTRPTDRFSLSFLGGFNVSGSTELSDVLPLQWGPTGAVRGRIGFTRQDGLTTAAQVHQATFVTGAQQLITLLTETWDRQLSRTVLLNLGAGAALTREVVVDPRQGIPGTFMEILPVGTASLGWRDTLRGHPLRLDTSLRVAPFADRFTGHVYERAELRVQGEWRPDRLWLVRASTGGALALPIGAAQQAGDRLVFTEGTVSWTMKTWLLLQASARVLWTEQPRTGNPGQVQAVGTVSVTVQDQDSLAW